MSDSARQRYLEAGSDREAMGAAWSWLLSELANNTGWQPDRDPIGKQHEGKKNRIRRQVANAIVAAIEDLSS